MPTATSSQESGLPDPSARDDGEISTALYLEDDDRRECKTGGSSFVQDVPEDATYILRITEATYDLRSTNEPL